MANRYLGKAQFLMVYIKEAHPADDWASEVNARLTYIKDPENILERAQVANTCLRDLDIDIPCLLDDMENTAAKAYKAWPDRLYLIAKNGAIAYIGNPGPTGVRPEHLEEALRKELGM